MSDNTLVRWGLSEMPPMVGDPFDLARSSCSRAVEVARDVSIDDQRFDNVIPAMLVYDGVVRLSPELHKKIHHERSPLPRGIEEAELRAVSLTACERIVAAAGHACSALDIGYYLWRSGKEPGKRQFARHHTKDTIFY